MNPQEQQLLETFLDRLVAIRGTAKDPQADALIQQRLYEQPDAGYLLVQRSLLQQVALDNAKAEIARLQAQVGNAGGGDAGFLGGQPDWSHSAATPPPVPQGPPPTPGWRERLFGGAPAAPVAAAQSAGPGFLASAATTAAGVAGGMFLFDGIESLLGGHHGDGLFGGGDQQPVVENVTENNFYDGNGTPDNSFGQDLGPSDSSFADTDFDDDNSWS
jgi:hypothetical protein